MWLSRHRVLLGTAAIVAATVGAVVVRAADADSPGYVSSYVPTTTVAPPPMPTIKGAPRILFYGDEITLGASSTGDAATYRDRVVAATSRSGHSRPTVIAHDGIRVGSFLSENRTPPGGFDLAIVELGTHDVTATPPELFRGSYGSLLTTLGIDKAAAALICLGVWANSIDAPPYDAVIRDQCRSAGGTYVPLYQLYTRESLRGQAGTHIDGRGVDRFHPNDAGHAAIADEILQTISIVD